MSNRAFGWVIGVAAIGIGACGAPPPPPEAPKQEASTDAGRQRATPSFESEVGALDESKVTATFQRSAEKLGACYAKGTEKLAYLAGEIRFVVRVARDGSTRWAFVEDSNLGDRETEACMLGVLKSLTWPKPEGGEGMAKNQFTFKPGDDERPPVAWSPDQLGAPYKRAKGALSACRKKAGAKPMKATFYVDTDGKPAAVGVSSADEKGEAAVNCVVSTLSGLTFPSPGSYASKVTIPIE